MRNNKEKYGDWIHPTQLGNDDVTEFLTWLAVERNVAPQYILDQCLADRSGSKDRYVMYVPTIGTNRVGTTSTNRQHKRQ